MKILKTKIMKSLLKDGIREAKKVHKVDSSDFSIPLLSLQLKNGWYYQVDKHYQGVTVYAYKPPKVYWAKSADYYLIKE
jgi:hypothetical protein